MALAELSSALDDCIKFFRAEVFPAEMRMQHQMEWEAMVAGLSSSVQAATLDWASHEEGARAGIFRQLADLGGVLSKLALNAPVTITPWPSVIYGTIHSCSYLARVAGLSGSDLFRWARCGTAVFSLGRRVLLSSLERASQRIGTDSLAQEATFSSVFLQAQLTTAAKQAVTAHALLTAVGQEPRILAAFAASVATPSEVVPWMALVATCINLAHEAGVNVQESGILLPFACACSPMLAYAPFSRHQAALEQAPMHQEPLVKALPHLLRAAHAGLCGCSWRGFGDNVAAVSMSPNMAGSSGSSRGSTSRASSASTSISTSPVDWVHAAYVLELVAVPCLGSTLHRTLTGGLCAGSTSGGGSSSSGRGAGSSSGRGGSSSSGRGGVSVSGGEAPALVQAVADLVCMVAEQSETAELAPRQRCQLAAAAAAAWGQLCDQLADLSTDGPALQDGQAMVVARGISMLPVVARLAEQLRQGQAQLVASGHPGPPGWLAQHHCDCDGYAAALMRGAAAALSQAPLSVAALQWGGGNVRHLQPDTLVALAHAAQASLLLLHFAAGSEPEQGSSAEGKVLARCCVVMCDVFTDVLGSNAVRIVNSGEPGMDRLEQPLRHALYTACRLAHFAAGRGEQWVAPDAWHKMLHWLTGLFAASTASTASPASTTALMRDEEGALSAQRRQACAAAFLAAARAVLERCQGGHELSLQGAQNVIRSLEGAHLLCHSWLPGSQLHTPAVEALTRAWRMIVQAPEEVQELAAGATTLVGEVGQLVLLVFGAAARMPLLAAHLISSGLMGELLQAGLHTPHGLPPPDPAYTGDLQLQLLAVLARLALAVQDAGTEDASSPAADLPLDVVMSAMQAAQAPLVLPGAPPASADTVLALYTSRLHPLASQLAAALEAHWQQRSQQAAAAVALAQVAATRGCAYLCCSNLGAAGAAGAGPDAGQVPGSKRCGGCRVVRYCDERCSRADWQAGHRRVCKKLAAIRVAEAERAQQSQHQLQL